MAKKKARHLWLARDEKPEAVYCVFAARPKVMDSFGVWEGGLYGGAAIMRTQSPVTLKPGEGPVRVRLVVDDD